MNSINTEKAIIKYLIEEANAEELELLSEWIQIPENQLFFEDYVKIHYKVTLAMSAPDVNAIKKNLLQKIRKDNKKVRRLKLRNIFLKYTAAVLLVGLIASYVFKNNLFNGGEENNAPIIVKSNVQPGTDKAILTLGNGSQLALIKGGTFKTQNANSNGTSIIYDSVNDDIADVEYNNLTIPRGGQFQITLSDGTKVWLNSESEIKYPTNFKDGALRSVELVYGEAYFEVSPSTAHKGSKFKVINQSQEIEVLGTEFNVKAYKDESNIYTTLVEGKVSVSFSDTNQILNPSQQSNLNLNNNIMDIATVNVYNEVSWKDGVFNFRRKPLVDIMTVLSRWYDTDVVFANPDIKNEGFNGVLHKNQKIEDILEAIKNFGIIKDYEISNKTIILK